MMSTQKGNVRKSGPQKYQNKSAFKNNLHDTTPRVKLMNSVVLGGVCRRCKDVIDWKIKYKKYKPLTVPKKCTKCLQKRIKQAYYTICIQCAKERNICAKCGEKSEIVEEAETRTPAEQMSNEAQLEAELKMLPERKRRTIFRVQQQGKLSSEQLEEACGDVDDEFLNDSDDLPTEDTDPDDEECHEDFCNESDETSKEKKSDETN
ncbi:uncharacterized protein C9orf85 homolog [Saccostrea echinata]|uniref:uncharacterized protein C9orf85 homolog n=1 Tax=Saccostrea echinata TaxID=191078 RepID=UPI002A833131|nr:uncharacterized protein C9orf85 homolog [Saccostrea echinata]